jgi:hypothetical protein
MLACAAVAAAVGVFQSGAPAVAADTWLGGTGTWNTPGSWSTGVPNSAATDVAIDGGNATNSSVTLDISPSIKSLTLDAGDSLTIASGQSLTIASGAAVNGTLTLNSTGSSTVLSFNGAQTLSGSGKVLFGGSTAFNTINGSGPLTIGPGISIRTGTQSGTISPTTLINQGLISAETSTKTLTINPTSFTNTGTAQATDGTLAITATSWTNSGTLGVSGNGVLQLGGTFTTAGLGTISRSGGTINVTGLLDNSNATLALTATTGSFNLAGGTLRGGTVTASGGAALAIPQFSSATLDGIANLNADLTLANGVSLSVINGLSVASGHTLTLGSTGSSTVMTFNGPQTLSGAGQVLFGGSTAFNTINGSGPLTIGPGISIRTGTQSGTISPTTLINQGLISAETSTKTLTINPTSFTNTGTAQATDGTLAITATSWTNSGTLGVSGNGVLQLGGTFTTAGLGTISRSGGTINVTGLLDNSNATLALTATTGSFNLAGGTLRGGTVTASGGAALAIPQFSSATLDGIANLNADLTLANGVSLSVINGLSVASGHTLTLGSTGSSTVMTFNGPQTLSGAGQVLFGGSTAFNTINGSGPLTIGPGISIRTGTQSGTISPTTLINHGLISAETSGKTITISSSPFTTTGTVQATDGTLAITSTSWTNSGTLGVSGNGVLQLGGTFTTAGLGTISRTGGTIEITGMLDNTNATLPLAATGSIILQNGTLRGGTVTTGGGAVLGIANFTTGTLDGVVLDTNFSSGTGATVAIPNALSLVNGHTFAMLGNQTFSGAGQFLFAGTGGASLVTGDTGLNITATFSIKTAGQGGTITVPSITNQGLISAETAGKTLTINGALNNTGTIRAQAGATLVLNNGVSGAGVASVDTFSTLQAPFIRQTSLTLAGNAGDSTSFAHVKINTKAQGGQTSVIKTLVLPTDASSHPLYSIDLTDNALAIDYTGASPMSAIKAAILSGRAGGAWNGPGITSSSLPANTSKALGYAEASDAIGASGGSFAGQSVDGTTVLVRYTLAGDVNLDGTVGFSDLVKLAQNYGLSDGSATWSKGDFSYDGNVGFADLVALAQNYGSSLPAEAIPGATADFASALAAAESSVPEPLSAPIFLSLALLGTTRRRRRIILDEGR